MWSALHFGKNQGKRKGTPISLLTLPSCQDSAQHSAAVNLSSPRLVWLSEAVSHRLTDSPTLRCQIVLPLAPIGSPMVVGDLVFTSLIPQVSLQASSQGKEVGDQASTRRASPVRGPILRCIIPLSWLVASLHPLKDEMNGDPRLLGSKRSQLSYHRRWEEHWQWHALHIMTDPPQQRH